MFDNRLFFGIDNKIYIWKIEGNKTFKPDAINFIFFAGLRFNAYIEIGYRHYCEHPIKAWDYGNESTIFERSLAEIYVELNFSLFED